MPTATETLIALIAQDGREPLSLPLKTARDELGRNHVLSPSDSNLKLVKGQKQGWETAGLSLAPHTMGGGPTVCPNSTPQCRAFCVSGSGNAISFADMINSARIKLTQLLMAKPVPFIRVMIEDLIIYQRAALLRGNKLAVRFNTFSDIEWERVAPEIFEMAQSLRIKCYDYTKIPGRTPPPNYHLTLSHSEVNKWGNDPDKITANGNNLAIPFAVNRGKPLPAKFNGIKVIDGDKTDLRFLDPSGVIVGLRSKITKIGKANTDNGFVFSIIGQ